VEAGATLEWSAAVLLLVDSAHRTLRRAVGDRGGPSSRRIRWPEGKRFALSIFDDTDRASLENVPHV
jgi:hypothetical protein